jgi:hypothetical protein
MNPLPGRRDLTVHLVADLPLQDRVVAVGAVLTGPRSVQWLRDTLQLPPDHDQEREARCWC